MKYVFYIFLYLNIYTIFSQPLSAQRISLEITAEIELSKPLRDSLQIKKLLPDRSAIPLETDSLSLKLSRLGFIENRLDSLVKKNDSAYIAHYHLGNRYRFLKIYYNQEYFSRKEISTLSKEVTTQYFVVSFTEIERTLKKLNTFQIESGNAFGKIALSDFRIRNETELSATLKKEDGVVRKIDDIVIKGYEKFPRSYLKYTSKIKKGTLFNKKEVSAQSKKLNTLPFASQIKPPEALFKNDSTTVYLYLKKENANNFDGILGFATNEETNKLSLNGYLNLDLHNNLNFGERLTINYKSDGNDQLNFGVTARLPYLFKSPIGTSVQLNIFKRDSSFVTTNQQIKVNYQLGIRSEIYVGYKTDASTNLLDTPEASADIQDYDSTFITGGVTYQIPSDSPVQFSPKFTLSLNGEIGRRKQENTTNAQQRLFAEASYLLNINRNNAIFVKNSSGLFLSDTYNTNELFRIGGITSIRGFNENSIDASSFALLNTEYRYHFTNQFYAHSIIDVGLVANSTIDLSERLYSFGFGIGLATKSGLLKLNLANGNSETQNFKFSNSKIHLSLTTRF